jgi:hypothetical protein
MLVSPVCCGSLLGEMAVNDNPSLRHFRKIVLCSSLTWVESDFEFLLPAHKTDTTFEGNQIHIAHIIGSPDPKPIMANYILSRDWLFPLHSQLWLHKNGLSPTRSWFLNRLKRYCSADITGQSMQACGATALTQAGASVELIEGAGHWSSNTFKRYIRKKCYSASCTHSRPCTSLLTYYLVFFPPFLTGTCTDISPSHHPASSSFLLSSKKKKLPFYHLPRYCTLQIIAKVCWALFAGRLFTN